MSVTLSSLLPQMMYLRSRQVSSSPHYSELAALFSRSSLILAHQHVVVVVLLLLLLMVIASSMLLLTESSFDVILKAE